MEKILVHRINKFLFAFILSATYLVTQKVKNITTVKGIQFQMIYSSTSIIVLINVLICECGLFWSRKLKGLHVRQGNYQQNVSTSYIASYSCNINFRTGYMCNILNADFSSVLSLRVGSFIFKLSLGLLKS